MSNESQNQSILQNDYDKEMLSIILDMRSKLPKAWVNSLKSKKNSHLMKWIESKTPLLSDKKYSVVTKLYWILHNIMDYPYCPFYDGNPCELGYDMKMRKNVDSFDKGYFRACCVECVRMKRKQSAKCKETMLDRYGSTNYFTSDTGKRKTAEWLQKNGITNAFQLESVKEKSKETRKRTFGYEYTMQSPEKRKLASDNYEKKTGYKHQFSDPTVKEKILTSMNSKKEQGIDVFSKRRTTNRSKRYDVFLRNPFISPLFSREDFIELNSKTQYTTALRWHCNECNTDFEAFIDQNFSSRNHIATRCPNCHPTIMDIGCSEKEQSLAKFIQSLDENLQVLTNDSTIIPPLEVDIFIPQKSVAIEFDGIYWHSENAGGKNSQYHLMKTERCNEKGIKLIHVFENEWDKKGDIVRSRISDILGYHENTVFARKCIVKEVTSSDSSMFQNINHIQGEVKSHVNVGLFYVDQLVSLMTFGKSRFDKAYEWELLRFCNKIGYHIPGGASKLLKYFERTYRPQSLISYADRRWSQGKLYDALGFECLHESPPNYWYWKSSSDLESRMKFQKHKLKDILPVFDANKSEYENMIANGYDRIFDCGNLVYGKTYTQSSALHTEASIT